MNSSCRKYLLCSVNQECVAGHLLSTSYAEWAQSLNIIYQSIIIKTQILGKQYFLRLIKQITIEFVFVFLTHKFEALSLINNSWEVIITPCSKHQHKSLLYAGSQYHSVVFFSFSFVSLTNYPLVLTSLLEKSVQKYLSLIHI